MKLEYDQCFYKYIEQKTKELFMSINSVNGISQMQNAQGVSFGSSNQDDGSGIDIGKLLAGGVAVAVAAGVGIAGYKSGQKLSAFKKDDGVLTTAWNGIKSWFGKNGDDVAQVSAECKTSLKTLFSGGEISSEAKHNIIANADEISEVFSKKAKKNAIKCDELDNIINIKDPTEKTNALAEFLKVKGELKLDKSTKKLDLSSLSLDDQVKITRKLKSVDGNIDTIDNIIKGLKTKYEIKLSNYENATTLVKGINLDDLNNVNSDIFADYTIAKRLNRVGAAQKIMTQNCEDSLSYINTQKSLTKWLQAGDLTQDEYDDLRVLAEQKFMSNNENGYLEYMTQGLKKKGGKNPIELNKLDSDDIATLNKQFPWLKLQSDTTSLTAENFVAKRKESATSISEYLGLNGYSLSARDANGFKLVDGNLVWEASAEGDTLPTKIFGNDIPSTIQSENNRITLNLDNLKEIFKSPVTQTSTPISIPIQILQ